MLLRGLAGLAEKGGEHDCSKKMGRLNAITRLALMDSTQAVMSEEGYAAVPSRRVAERTGVDQQTVYYYFQTMDDLLLATYRRRTQSVVDRVELR